MSYSDLISDGGMDPRERELIGYTEREEGFYPLYKSEPGRMACGNTTLHADAVVLR